jgi:hypothetical protein
MLKKVLIATGLIVLIVGIVIVYNWNNFPTTVSIFEKKEEQNPWSPIVFITVNDSDQVVKIVYQEKYGLEKVEYCMAVFSSKEEYKCVAPWLGDLILQKQNLNSFKTQKVPKTEMKNE